MHFTNTVTLSANIVLKPSPVLRRESGCSSAMISHDVGLRTVFLPSVSTLVGVGNRTLLTWHLDYDVDIIRPHKFRSAGGNQSRVDIYDTRRYVFQGPARSYGLILTFNSR